MVKKGDDVIRKASEQTKKKKNTRGIKDQFNLKNKQGICCYTFYLYINI